MLPVQALEKLGYSDILTYKEDKLHLISKKKSLDAHSLFFVDGGYSLNNIYIFAISSPINKIKGLLLLSYNEYRELMDSSLSKKFTLLIEENPKEVVIRRQYGMRKVLKEEFDPKRYVLKKGFPDFPACPYGHTFKMLGYDKQTKTYVRLAPAILRDKSLKILEYKE